MPGYASNPGKSSKIRGSTLGFRKISKISKMLPQRSLLSKPKLSSSFPFPTGEDERSEDEVLDVVKGEEELSPFTRIGLPYRIDTSCGLILALGLALI